MNIIIVFLVPAKTETTHGKTIAASCLYTLQLIFELKHLLLCSFATTRRFDIGVKVEFKVTLRPSDGSPAYSQCLPGPILLKEDKIVELVLLHRHAIHTTLPVSKYGSPIYAQKKPNQKLCIMVDLRKINNLFPVEYYNNNNHHKLAR